MRPSWIRWLEASPTQDVRGARLRTKLVLARVAQTCVKRDWDRCPFRLRLGGLCFSSRKPLLSRKQGGSYISKTLATRKQLPLPFGEGEAFGTGLCDNLLSELLDV